ncbi:MAG: 4'-phosphopantetheinyl transferase superfamily protein [Candidatus Paracaedibacteraceae bacterium]|nr:4'-phosphopantetheinyl transferase superfamily protein [Candidatus Paracaedibacteraceae bacterium]
MPDYARVVLVHLDKIDTDDAVSLDHYLDASEKKQLKKMTNDSKKHTFRMCRFVAKQLLAEFFDLNIKELHFEYTSRGKPFFSVENIHFNISHSGNLALIGVSLFPIGVDIEQIKMNRDFKGLSDKILSEDEQKWVFEEDAEQRFYVLWTLKEARLKCDGTGIDGHFPTAVFDDEQGWTYDGYHVISGCIEKYENYACTICIQSEEK